MKILESAENYLETILILEKRQGKVRSVDIANELDFTKPSVSVAMKNLRENNYIDMDENGRITLLDKGRAIAEEMYERHRLLTEFFERLGVENDIAELDACKIEHIISMESFDAIKNHMEKMNK